MLKSKKVLSVLLSSVIVLGMNTSAFASEVSEPDIANIPQVNYTEDVNNYDEFIFGAETRGVEEQVSKWDWNKGAYKVDGTSNSGSTLYTNRYFKDVVGRTFSFTAGYANPVTVDLVHKGLVIQTVVSTWTIGAGKTKTVEIEKDDLDGKSENGSYYFRFNSDPIGDSYSISGTFE